MHKKILHNTVHHNMYITESFENTQYYIGYIMQSNTSPTLYIYTSTNAGKHRELTTSVECFQWSFQHCTIKVFSIYNRGFAYYFVKCKHAKVTRSHTHTHTHRARSRTHARTHARTHTHTHTHTPSALFVPEIMGFFLYCFVFNVFFACPCQDLCFLPSRFLLVIISQRPPLYTTSCVQSELDWGKNVT